MLVLGEPVDRARGGSGLPVVFGQDVLGTADLADDVVLGIGPRVSRALQPRLTGETFWVNASIEVQAD